MNENIKLKKKIRCSDNIILQIFSPEVIDLFDSIGINSTPMDLCTDNPLYLDFRRLFKINVPRFFTFTDLLNFISDHTHIPSKEIMIFEYLPNQKENFIKRSDYNLKEIKPEEYDSLIEIYTSNHKQYFPLLFLYSKNQKYKFFKYKPENSGENSNTANDEDYEIKNTKNTLSGHVYIASHWSFLEFRKNSIDAVSDDESEKVIFNHEVDEKKSNLIFLKLFFPNRLLEYLNLIEDCNKKINKINYYSDEYSLRIIEVFDFTYNKLESGPKLILSLKAKFIKKLEEYLVLLKINSTEEVYEFITSLKDNLEKKDFSFITERTCLSNYPSDKLYEEISTENIIEILDKNAGIILIPSACEDNSSELAKEIILEPLSIKKQLEIYFNKIFIDVFCLSSNKLLSEKMEFNIREITDEKTIKQKIFDKIKQKKLFNLIFNLQNHFIITANQETISAEDFIEKIDLSYFELTNNRESNGKTNNMYKEIPIAKFVNNTEMRIDVSFSFIPKSNLSEFKNFEVSLFDKDSNIIALLSCVLPRKIKRSKDIVDFIAKSKRINKVFDYYNNDLFKSSSQVALNKLNVNNTYFILQHSRDYFIFHLITDESTDVFQFEGKGDYKYRLQMYDEALISKIHDPSYSKIYVKVNVFSSNLEVKVDPLIIYLEKNQTNFELKLEVFKCLENLRNLNKALSPNYSNLQEFLQNEKNLEKIKFFKCAVHAGKFNKASNLNALKDDDYVETIFKGERICNLLVEISLNNLFN